MKLTANIKRVGYAEILYKLYCNIVSILNKCIEDACSNYIEVAHKLVAGELEYFILYYSLQTSEKLLLFS